MASPFGLMLADIFMSSFENGLSSSIDQLAAYYKYVDDTVVLCSGSEQVNTFLQLSKNIPVWCLSWKKQLIIHFWT